MPSTGALFTVDLEHSQAGTMLPEKWRQRYAWHAEDTTDRLLHVLKRNGVRAHFFVLGWLIPQCRSLIYDLKFDGHTIGSHGYWHRRNEKERDLSDLRAREVIGDCVGYRSPHWDTTPRPTPPAGGTYFRVLPVREIVRRVRRSGVFWVHPHDLSKDPSDSYWRHKIFIGDPWKKLERILTEVKWADPSKGSY